MQIWKQYKLDEKLLEIYEKDFAVLTGISAGAICWFNCGYSDSGSFQEGNDWNYCWANGMLRAKNLAGLAMENDTAFVVNNGKPYFIRSNPNANAFKIQYKNGTIEKQALKFTA